MNYMGLKYRKGDYLKSLMEPHFIFFPMNLIGSWQSLFLSVFVSLVTSFPVIILTLYYALTSLFAQFGIPALLHAFFDVIFGGLQTYIFVIISLMLSELRLMKIGDYRKYFKKQNLIGGIYL